MQAVRWSIVQPYLSTLQDNILLVFCEMREMSFFKKIKLIIFLSKNDISRISQSHACVQQTYFP